MAAALESFWIVGIDYRAGYLHLNADAPKRVCKGTTEAKEKGKSLQDALPQIYTSAVEFCKQEQIDVARVDTSCIEGCHHPSGDYEELNCK